MFIFIYIKRVIYTLLVAFQFKRKEIINEKKMLFEGSIEEVRLINWAAPEYEDCLPLLTLEFGVISELFLTRSGVC